jgi:membrane protein YdbS with pleckstrin-like domain
MSYIDESLAAGETLLYRARFHWLQKAGAWFVLALFLVAAVVCLFLADGSVALLAALACIVVGLVLFVPMMMPFWTTEIGVTTQRFIYKRGWLNRRTDELQLNSIEEVNLEQGAMGRLMDYGRLILHGTGVNDITLPVLADPVGLRRSLQEGMGAATAAAPVTVIAEQPAA